MALKNHKYIFVIGGVMSGVGKGIATSAIGRILEGRGVRVNLVKVDPYLNVDAGTMNPTEHGEVFVLSSGLETDQDMGNYERFLGRDLSPHDYMTSGMVYQAVIERERSLGYSGKFVEAIPHVRDEIIRRFEVAAAHNGSEVSVIEIGGTIGDFQNALFIEAARTLRVRCPGNVFFILVSYLPVPKSIGEMKTRPTQHAVRELNSYGVGADMIIARSEIVLDKKRKEKLAIWCNISPEAIISAPDIESIYDVPINFEKDHLGELILGKLGVGAKHGKTDLSSWRRFVTKIKNAQDEVRIAIIGKYFNTGDFVLSDAYISVIEAIKFSSYYMGRKPVISWLNSLEYEENPRKLRELSRYDGVIIPGGFGSRGVEGKIKAIRYVREHMIPYFGLCYGMQLAIVEYARSVVGLKEAHTTEVGKDTLHPVIDILPEQKKILERENYGATMRLGVYPALLKKGTIARSAYKEEAVNERHRHRYEVNPEYVEHLEKAGLVFSGISPDRKLMEIMELSKKRHPFFLATQFHPEFQARPLAPHPLFTEFVKACMKRR